MKIDTVLWAVKLRGRSFYKSNAGSLLAWPKKSQAMMCAESIELTTGIKAEATRVRVRIEEKS